VDLVARGAGGREACGRRGRGKGQQLSPDTVPTSRWPPGRDGRDGRVGHRSLPVRVGHRMAASSLRPARSPERAGPRAHLAVEVDGCELLADLAARPTCGPACGEQDGPGSAAPGGWGRARAMCDGGCATRTSGFVVSREVAGGRGNSHILRVEPICRDPRPPADRIQERRPTRCRPGSAAALSGGALMAELGVVTGRCSVWTEVPAPKRLPAADRCGSAAPAEHAGMTSAERRTSAGECPRARCLHQVRLRRGAGRIDVGCPTRDSDAQTQPEARSCVTVRSGLLRVPAQIGQRRTR
jgi:hypothetical protein